MFRHTTIFDLTGSTEWRLRSFRLADDPPVSDDLSRAMTGLALPACRHKQCGKFWDMLEASVSTWVVCPAGGDDFVVSRSV
jgi:hypothetical protein